MAFTHVKITMKIISSNGDDFSDSFYTPASSLSSVDLLGQTLCSKRRNCLTDGWRVLWWTARSAPIPGTEVGVRAGLKRRNGTGNGHLTGTRDAANVCILVNMQAGDHNRAYAVHGCPDNAVQFDVHDNETTVIYPELKDYLDYLSSGPWQLKVALRLFNDPLNKPITEVGVAAGIVTFTCPGLAAMNPGDKFLVSACKGFHGSQFDGNWKVQSHNATSGVITTATTRRIDSNFFYVPSSGNVRPVNGTQVGFSNITGYAAGAVKSSTHKTGNPAEERRGRRSAAR